METRHRVTAEIPADARRAIAVPLIGNLAHAAPCLWGMVPTPNASRTASGADAEGPGRLAAGECRRATGSPGDADDCKRRTV